MSLPFLLRWCLCQYASFPFTFRLISYPQVTLVHDWRFKSLPPYAFAPNQRAHAISFHKSHVKEVHAFLQTQGFGGTSLVGEAAAAMAPSLYQFNNQTGEKVRRSDQSVDEKGAAHGQWLVLRVVRVGSDKSFEYAATRRRVYLFLPVNAAAACVYAYAHFIPSCPHPFIRARHPCRCTTRIWNWRSGALCARRRCS